MKRKYGLLINMVLCLTVFIYLSISRLVTFGQDMEQAILETLREGEKYNLSRFTSGKGTLTVHMFGVIKKGEGIKVEEVHSRVNSVFSGERVRLDEEITPYLDGKPDSSKMVEVRNSATDGQIVKDLFLGRKLLEIRPYNSAEKRRIERGSPFKQGQFLNSFSNLWSLRVTGEEMVNSSLCYVVEGLRTGNADSTEYKMRSRVLIDANRGFWIVELKCWMQKGNQEEILLEDYMTKLKEYSPGFWAPCEISKINYDADKSDLKGTLYMRESIKVIVEEYVYNVPILPESFELNISPGTIVRDMIAGITYNFLE